MSTSDRELPSTDPDLVRRAMAGEREAWDSLFAATRERLAARIEARLGPALRARVEVGDILQETCLLAYRSRDRFEWRGEAHFLGWLSTLAGYVIRGTARHERGQPGTIERLDDAMLADIDVDPPSRGMRREERFERLLRAYEKLSPDHRKVLRLVRLEGLSVSKVAQRLNRSESAVRHLVLRALESLREEFGEATGSVRLPARRLDAAECEPGEETDGARA